MKLTGKPIDPTATIRRILRPRAIRRPRAAVVLAAAVTSVAIPLAVSASAQAAPTSATTITAGHNARTIPPQVLRLIRESRHLPPAHQAGPRILRSATPNATGTANSQAWSGYVDSARNVAFRYVSANFNIPSLNCASSPPGSSGVAAADPSVGLGGFSSNGVSGEQVGA